MAIEIVLGIAFAAVACLGLAVILVVRDLAGAGENSDVKLTSLRRPYNVTDELPSSSFTGRIDQAFERLVLETGLEASPAAAFGLLVFIGLSIAGGMFLWQDHPLSALFGMLIGMSAGLMYLIWRRVQRQRMIRELLPDTLDLMSRAVRAGESLDQAIALIGEETSGPLAYEFQLCSRQLNMGMSISGVMKSLMRRVRLMEIRILATTLMVPRQTGGNRALTLERMAAVIKDRLNYQKQMKAATGAGRISAMFIALAGPFMFLALFVLQYEHLKIMFEQPLGQMLLAIAAVLEIVGGIWVMGLLKTE